MNPEEVQAGLVSILICTYNGGDFLGGTLESALKQTYAPLEVIVVDDGSSDGTWELLQSYGARIRAIRQENGGVAAARNTGLRSARGEFIALMDHDDLCEIERIAVQVAFLRQHPDLALCSSDFSAFDQNGPLATSYCGEYYSQCHSSRGGVMARYPEQDSLDVTDCLHPKPSGPVLVPTYLGRVYEELALGNFVHPPTVMFRRSLLAEVGDFDTTARNMCDWDWLVRAARVARIGFIHRSLLRYRRSETQISSSRHQPRASVDALHVAQRICERDPVLYRKRSALFRAHLGEMCLDAANCNAELRRLTAMRLLLASVFRYATVQDQTFRTLFKILTPTSLLNSIRKLSRA
jgi:glycosyltransferase involved in cell wall biosynthesis